MRTSVDRPPPIVPVVEDADDAFDTVRDVVGRLGIPAEVRRAATGDACLRLLLGAGCAPIRPAIVLMDLNLPGTDGREALAAIKAEPSLRAVPVVIHTTSSNPKDVSSCHDAGTGACRVKPLRYSEHLESLSEVLAYRLARVVLPEEERPGP